MTAHHTITVWIVEDDPLYREAVSELIRGEPSLRLDDVFASYEELLDHLPAPDPPDVILSDVSLPGMSGIDGTREIKSQTPSSQIIMLTVHEDDDVIFEAMRAGASGYLLKSATADRILGAIREVYAGGLPFSAGIARKVLSVFSGAPSPRDDHGLTPREFEILEMLAAGETHRSIADTLFLSPHTVDAHLRNIYAKLHVNSGIAAVSKAIREGLI